MEKGRYAELKEVLVSVFDEAIAVLAEFAREGESDLSREQIHATLSETYSAAVFASDRELKEDMLSFIAAEDNMGMEESVDTSEEQKRDTIRLLRHIEKDMRGDKALQNAQFALHLISIGYERHKLREASLN